MEHGDSAQVILDCGGRWDRKQERFVDDGRGALVLRMQPAQYDAAYWFAGWLRAYLTGTKGGSEFDRIWTMMNAGPRRAGKTELSIYAAAAFVAASPGAVVWGCSPAEPETVELQDSFDRVLPGPWAHFAESKLVYTLPNLSKIELRSGYKPSALKRGRADLVLFNEAQGFPEAAYSKVRGAIADRGGLVLLQCNPPDKPVGQWLMDRYDEAKAGRSTIKLFEFDPRLNPYINFNALDDMKHDVSELEYRREVLGEFIPIGDFVFYAWSPRENIKPAPDLGEVTREFTKRRLGREFGNVIAVDFQLSPHMAGVAAKFFRNPEDETDPIGWYTDEFLVEGTEDDLIDSIEEKGYNPDDTAIIADASGWWQDAERTKGRASVDRFKRRGWRWIYRPDEKAKRNPEVIERVSATNARMKNARGERRIYSVPENFYLNRAIKKWPNKGGIPNKRSEFAHLCDCASYLIYRFHPRRWRGAGVEYRKGERRKRSREKDLDRL